MLSDAGGASQDSYVYDSWGIVKSQTGSLASSFGYTGREFSEASLDFYRARYYSPTIGRFVSEDPLVNVDFSAVFGRPTALVNRGADNLYLYTQNKPIRYVDPMGLRKCESGQCPDCPSGIWFFDEVSVSAFGWWGGKGGAVKAQCLLKAFHCTYLFICGSVGAGVDVSGSGGSGAAGFPGKCQCGEDLAGTVVSFEAGAAPGSAEFSPGPSKCLALGQSGGKGLTTPFSRVNACKYFKTSCSPGW